MEETLGGTPPFLYSFENGPFGNQTSFLQLPAGNYQLDVQDINGCTWSEQISIDQMDEIEINLGVDRKITFGDSIELMISTE